MNNILSNQKMNFSRAISIAQETLSFSFSFPALASTGCPFCSHNSSNDQYANLFSLQPWHEAASDGSNAILY